MISMIHTIIANDLYYISYTDAEADAIKLKHGSEKGSPRFARQQNYVTHITSHHITSHYLTLRTVLMATVVITVFTIHSSIIPMVTSNKVT